MGLNTDSWTLHVSKMECFSVWFFSVGALGLPTLVRYTMLGLYTAESFRCNFLC